jgi:hypothetical protein
MADIRHRQKARFDCHAFERCSIGLGHIRVNDDVVGALREKNGISGGKRPDDFCVSGVCQIPMLDGLGGREILFQRLLGVLTVLERSLDV